MTETVETLVIGAGVVGLAAARALALAGREVLILEAADAIGTGTSSRNSEVIHGGLYYAPGSLKARLCVAGRERLYAYCESRHVEHRRLGKLIVATAPEEIVKLDEIAARGAASGVADLQRLTAEEAQAMEPALACVAALHSPSTGIVDSHGLMLSLLGEAEDNGAMLALNAPVARIAARPEGLLVETGGTDAMTLLAREVVIAAGLSAVPMLRALEGVALERLPEPLFAKGNYFRLIGRAPFSRLIYPAPVEGGLGVHLTLDLAGQARFGPDVEWLEREPFDLSVDPRRGDSFTAAIRRYWPALPEHALAPDYAGIRTKIAGPDGPILDFMIADADRHGVAGLVGLLGFESPGLTAALATADEVVARLERDRGSRTDAAAE